jgi:hypothetical protein
MEAYATAEPISVSPNLRALPARPSSAPVPVLARYSSPPLARRGVATQLSGDRRRRATEPAGDLPHTTPAGAQQRDLLPLNKRQITPRQRGQGH